MLRARPLGFVVFIFLTVFLVILLAGTLLFCRLGALGPGAKRLNSEREVRGAAAPRLKSISEKY